MIVVSLSYYSNGYSIPRCLKTFHRYTSCNCYDKHGSKIDMNECSSFCDGSCTEYYHKKINIAMQRVIKHPMMGKELKDMALRSMMILHYYYFNNLAIMPL